jgi:glycogen operon protein
MGRTQRGNNNAYCQDNEMSWLDWDLRADERRLRAFVQRLITLRRGHPVFRRRHFFAGRPLRGREMKDIVWLKPDGAEMTDEEWDQHFARCLGVYLSGMGLTETDARGRPLVDDDFVVLFNAHHEPIDFRLPLIGRGDWESVLDTGVEAGGPLPGWQRSPERPYPLGGRTLALLVQRRAVGDAA